MGSTEQHQSYVPIELSTPTSLEKYRPNESIQDTIGRIANLVDGTSTNSPDADPKRFLEEARTRAEEFSKYYEKPEHKMTEEKRRTFNEWVKQDENETGKHRLDSLTNAFAALWVSIKTPGLPGHDRRHLQEDLKAGLQFRADLVNNDETDNYQKVSLLGSWMHDIGRLVEERMQGTPTGGEMGKDHAKMSFAITKDILDHFSDIPQELRDHLAYSVLNHQTWPNAERKQKDPIGYSLIMDEPMPRSVMGADRLQLIGPEGIMRFWAFDAGLEGKDILPNINPEKKTALTNNTDIAHHAEFYMRNLLPVDVPGSPEKANILVKERADRYKSIAGTYLWLSSTDEIREQIFAPELARERGESINNDALKQNKKTPLDEKVWKQINEVKNNGLPSDIKKKVAEIFRGRSTESLEQLDKEDLTQVVKVLTREMVSAPKASVTEKQLDTLNKKIEGITNKQALARLAEGLGYIITMRTIIDEEHNQVLKTILTDQKNYPLHSIEHKLATFISLS